MVTAAHIEPAAPPQVEIVVPVYNEEHVLARSVRRLHEFVEESFPFSWRITIADNASTDGTLDVARRLEYELPGVAVLPLPAKGRGRGLGGGWSGAGGGGGGFMGVEPSAGPRA